MLRLNSFKILNVKFGTQNSSTILNKTHTDNMSRFNPEWAELEFNNSLTGAIYDKISDNDLREVLLRGPNDRNHLGEITNPEVIFRYVPQKFQNREVSHHVAVSVFGVAFYNYLNNKMHDIQS